MFTEKKAFQYTLFSFFIRIRGIYKVIILSAEFSSIYSASELNSITPDLIELRCEEKNNGKREQRKAESAVQ